MAAYNINTEQKILLAATKIFSTKGMQGARMQEIADEAGINKALLHYYFRNKETLFKASFHILAEKMFKNIGELLSSDLELFEKIERFVHVYLALINENPHIPMFILNELANSKEELATFFKKMPLNLKPFMNQIEKAVKNGLIRPIYPPELLINIVALSVFPFAAKPIINNIIVKNTGMDFEKFIENRKKTIPEFIINAIKL